MSLHIACKFCTSNDHSFTLGSDLSYGLYGKLMWFCELSRIKEGIFQRHFYIYSSLVTAYLLLIKLMHNCSPQYLVYDTQMVMGGRKHELSPEEHIYGALVLYLDIIYIFISLLSLFGSKN